MTLTKIHLFSRKAALLALAPLAAIVLVACGGSGSSSTSTTPTPPPANTVELSVKPALGGFSGGANVGVYYCSTFALCGPPLCLACDFQISRTAASSPVAPTGISSTQPIFAKICLGG